MSRDSTPARFAGTPIIPIIVGDSLRAAQLSALLLASGVNVQPMVAPAVPNEQARLRFFVAATHTEAELETTVRLLGDGDAALDEPDDSPTHALDVGERCALHG